MGVTGSCPGRVAQSVPKDSGSCLQGAVCHALVFDVPLEERDEDQCRHGHVKDFVRRLSVVCYLASHCVLVLHKGLPRASLPGMLPASPSPRAA